MPYPNQLKATDAITGAIREELIPELISTLNAPHKVAARLDVAPNTIRTWLLKNGYQYLDGKWIKTEAVHETA